MQVPRTATSGANGQSSGKMRVRSSGKGCGLFMTDVNPLDFLLFPYRIHDSVEGVAREPVNSVDARRGESLYQYVCNLLRHDPALPEYQRFGKYSLWTGQRAPRRFTTRRVNDTTRKTAPAVISADW